MHPEAFKNSACSVTDPCYAASPHCSLKNARHSFFESLSPANMPCRGAAHIDLPKKWTVCIDLQIEWIVQYTIHNFFSNNYRPFYCPSRHFVHTAASHKRQLRSTPRNFLPRIQTYTQSALLRHIPDRCPRKAGWSSSWTIWAARRGRQT